MTLNLAAPLFLHSRLTPSATALVVDEREYSYEALAAAAGRTAAWVQSWAHGGWPRIGILAGRSLDTYAGILGAVWAGGAYVPLNLKMPASRLATIVTQAKLDAIIADARGALKLKELGDALPAHVLACTADVKCTSWEVVNELAPSRAPAAVEPDQPGYVIFTSGTTGVPKGVVVSVSNIANYLAASQALYRFGPSDRFAQFFETTFDPSIAEMFMCWGGGASLHVVPETKVMMPIGFIKQRQLTVWLGVPSVIAMGQRLNQLAPGSLPSVRVSQFGGEGFSVAAAQTWKAAAVNSVIDNQYGPTECAVGCLFYRLSEQPVLTRERGTLAIGRPLPGMEAAIIDDEGNFLGPGETGELALHGPQVAIGYLGDETKTAARFRMLNHPLGLTRWYLTGDLAYFDEAGQFHCLGRSDNQVKVMGHRVELEEVEAHLRTICKSEAVAAVAWPLVNGNASGIVAFVSGVGLDGGMVREKLKVRVPHYMLPSRVMSLEVIPLSTNGKVDRHALQAMLERQPVA